MNSEDLKKALKKHFGFSAFKGLQESVISHLLKQENSFVIMPTGGGKSLCYQLPALMQEGTAIVVSPLIALMKNQVDAIRGISSENGIAHVLNSSLNKTAVEQVKSDIRNGITKLLYVAPESLSKKENIEFFKTVNISFLAVDEAHCISEWGHDFRPEYRNLRSILEQFEQVIPIIALTATATPTKVVDEAINGWYHEYLHATYENWPRREEDLESLVDFASKHENLAEMLTQLILLSSESGDRVVRKGESCLQ